MCLPFELYIIKCPGPVDSLLNDILPLPQFSILLFGCPNNTYKSKHSPPNLIYNTTIMGDSEQLLTYQHYKEIAAIAQKRRIDALPKEYLLTEGVLKDLPRNVTTIPRTSEHFTHEELEIIEASAEDILQNIRERVWTSVEVTKAFSKAAVVAHQLVNYFMTSK